MKSHYQDNDEKGPVLRCRFALFDVKQPDGL